MKRYFALLSCIIFFVLVGCSVNEDSVKDTLVSHQESFWDMYNIPADKHIIKTYRNPDSISYKEALTLMEEDLATANSQNYDALNSFWYDVVCGRARKTFTDEQKWKFLSREADKEGLLPFYGAYYSLLASCKEFKNREQMGVLGNKVSTNAHIIINSMPDEANAKSYNNDLIYAKRMYGLLLMSNGEKSK